MSSTPAVAAPPKPWETSNGNAEAGPSTGTAAFDQAAAAQQGGQTTVTTDRAPDLPDRPGEMGAAGATQNAVGGERWLSINAR